METGEGKAEGNTVSKADEIEPKSPKSVASTSGAERTDATASDDSKLTLDEKIVKAEECKADGNGLLKEGQLKGALERYEKGLKLLEEHVEADSSLPFVTQVYVPLRLNGAAAALKSDASMKCKEHCNKVLLIDPNNVKALYRRAVAHRGLSDYDQAVQDLVQLIHIEPQNKAARSELNAVRECKKEHARLEKEQFQKAFGKSLYDDEHKKLEQLHKEYEVYVETRNAANEAAETDADKEEVQTFEVWKKKQLQREADEKLVKNKEVVDSTPDPTERQVKTEVMRCDDEDLDAEERKLLSEVKGKGYYHGRLGTVLSNDAPKPQALSQAETQEAKGGSGSAWNQSGTTWEEKNTTDMVKNLFKTTLRGIKIQVSEDESAGVMKMYPSIKDCHAAIATIRGTLRYMFDITCTVKFKRRLVDKDEDIGQFSFEFTDATNIDELSLNIDKCADMNSCALKALQEGCRAFVSEYQKHKLIK